MKNKIPATLNNLVGMKCSNIRIGYAQALLIGFGEVTKKVIKDRSFLYTEWEFITESCVWRVEYNGEILCGSYDLPEYNVPILESLLSKELISISHVTYLDIKFEFEEGYILYFFGQSALDEYFYFLIPNNKCLSFAPDKGWIESQADSFPEPLNEREKFIDVLSEECHNRWSSIVVKSLTDHICTNCIYYRPFRGEFYFWDYGVCSCKESKYDGKLVSVKSGCNNYRENI